MFLRYNVTEMRMKILKIILWVGIFLGFAGTVVFLLPKAYLSFKGAHSMPSSLASPDSSVREILKEVIDPETNLSVVDMGLIREVSVSKEGSVTVKMILTSRRCPYGWYLRRQVKNAVESISSVGHAEVIIEEGILWGPEMMTEAGQKWLKEYTR